MPVGGGTDATRVASYDPWVGLYWLVTGKTLGGLGLYPESNRLSRREALTLYTRGSAWFSGEQEEKGAIAVGQLADLAVLSADFFAVPEEEIRAIVSELTLVGGEVVYAAGAFSDQAPPPLPIDPSWSPVGAYGGYEKRLTLPNERMALAPTLGSCSASPLDGLSGAMRRAWDEARAWLAGPQRGGDAPGLTCGCFAY